MVNKQAFTVSDAIVEELVAAGVEVVYGIVSIHNMPIYDAIYREGSIRLVTARGESGAVNMADAYARVTGKMGVVLTSTGAGAGNGAGSLTEAWNAGTPILHITGEAHADFIGTDQRYIHECKDQLKMMDGANKSAYLLKRPKQVTPFMRKAIQEAQAVPTGPVTVQIPTNFQAQIIPKNNLLEVESIPVTKLEIDLPEEIIEKIKTAKRPVVWAGNGVVGAGASAALRELVKKINPAVVTSEAAKGVVPENDPLCIGNFAATPQFAALLEKADLLISVGVHFRLTETLDATLPVPENHINIDANPDAFNRNFETKYSLVGDAKLVLDAMNKALGEEQIGSDTAYQQEVKEVRDAVRAEMAETYKPYGDIANIMRNHMPENSILLNDVTISGYTWGNTLIDAYEPREYVYVAGGGIGQGLPLAIGAKIGQPDKPVVLIAGDGGFMVNAGEMITATHEDAPVIVVLFDDGGYGILRYYQEAAYARRTSVDLVNPDFEMMAKSMGFAAEKVASVTDFEQRFQKALANHTSTMIVVDVNEIGPLSYEDSEPYLASFRPHEAE